MIPDYVAKHGDVVANEWLSVYDSFADKVGDEWALIIANQWLLTKPVVCTKDSCEPVVMSLSFVKDGSLVKNSDGTSYVDFVLTDNGYNRQGMKVSENLMLKWVDMINNKTLKIKGDVDHKDWDTLMNNGVSKESFISTLRKFKKSFAEGVKAIYDNGKMWIRAAIKPGYEDLVAKATGVSLEADLEIDKDGVAVDGELGGFTFTINTEPVNPRSVIDKK